MGDRIRMALDELASLGASLKMGVPAGDAQVASLKSASTCAFPEDYVQFLRTHGALHITHDAVPRSIYAFGHAPDDTELDASAIAKNVTEEFESWGHDPQVVWPVWGDAPSSSSFTVLDTGGAVVEFWRGQLEVIEDSFEDYAVEKLEAFARDIRDATRATSHQRDIMARIAELVPAELRVPSVESDQRLVVRRPSDGVLIELRPGDGREYSFKKPGVFVSWTLPQAMSLEAINEWNRRAWFVRGSVRGTGCRFRGRFPATADDVPVWIHALAHDAEIPIDVQLAAAPTLDEIARLFGDAAPASPERGLLNSLMGLFSKTTAASSRDADSGVRRDGDELVVTVNTLPDSDRYPIGSVRVTVVPSGLVIGRHDTAPRRPRAELLLVANTSNGGEIPIDDVNLDLEDFTSVIIHDDRVALRFATTARGIEDGYSEIAIGEMQSTARKSGLVEPADPMLKRNAALAALVGLDVGPATKRLLASLPFTGSRVGLEFGFESGRARTVTTPWGTVAPFMHVRDAMIPSYLPVSIGLVPRTGGEVAANTDQCRVVGVFEEEAVLLANDVRSFISVMVLGVTGFAFDGDDDAVWRNYRDLVSHEADLSDHFFQAGEDLCRDLGIDPAPSVAAVLAAVGPAQRAKVSHGKS